MKRAFQILYPGDAQYDVTGKMIDTPPLPPHLVARQVDAVNSEMTAMDEGPNHGTGSGKPHDGMVHVDAHVRDGGKTEVSDYWRNPPNHGGGTDKGAPDQGVGHEGASDIGSAGQDEVAEAGPNDGPKSVSPVPNPEMRNDLEGLGHFRARRISGPHKGIDILAEAGAEVVSPIDGEITRIAPAYKNHLFNDEFLVVDIQGRDGNTYILRYVSPTDSEGNSLVKEGDGVKAGDPIGMVQNRAAREPSSKMKNHIHLEMKGKEGNIIDPTPHFRHWRKR